MPHNFETLGAKEEDIDALAQNACFGDVNTGKICGFTELDKTDVANIYKLMI